METFRRIVNLLSRIGAVLAGLALAAIVVLITVEMASRLLFGRSFGEAWVYSTYLLAVALFCGLAHAAAGEGHIRVELLASRLSASSARRLDGLVSLVGTAIALLLTFALGRLAWRSFVGGTVSFTPDQTPLFLPQSLVAAGAGLLALQLLLRAIDNLRAKR